MRLAVPDKDPVSALTEYAQAQGLTATIVVEGQTGPAHCPTYVASSSTGQLEFLKSNCSAVIYEKQLINCN